MGAIKEYFRGGYNKHLKDECELDYQMEEWKRESTRKKAEKIKKYFKEDIPEETCSECDFITNKYKEYSGVIVCDICLGEEE